MRRFRYRIHHCKLAPFHLLSHLDVYRTWERVFRRASITVLYSQGFNPRPLFSFPLATPLGIESEAEYFETFCGEPLFPEEFKEKLDKEVPQELKILEVQALPSFDPPLQKVMRGIVYVFSFSSEVILPESLSLPEGVTLFSSVENPPMVSFLFEGEKMLWNPLKLASLLEESCGFPMPKRILKEKVLLDSGNGG
ncbi:MAG: TIGR03936 family radical SAM-associated protein [Candidatus Caldatribacteriaceae bacterium]